MRLEAEKEKYFIFLLNLTHVFLYEGPLISLFLTSGDISEFQSQISQTYSYLAEMYMMYISLDSPLV